MHRIIWNSRHKIILLKSLLPKIYIITKSLLLMQTIACSTAKTFYFIHWMGELREPKILLCVLVKTKDSATGPYKPGYSSSFLAVGHGYLEQSNILYWHSGSKEELHRI
jgi:hypothetical protein